MSNFEELDKVALELRTNEPDEYGHFDWRAAPCTTDREFLDDIYTKLPAPFPRLYEDLVLSYRWAKVDLGCFRLLPNPPSEDLVGLFCEMSKDKGLWESLIPAGYIQFGQGPDVDYDPVCFDTRRKTGKNDYRVVKIDHEEILCNFRVKVVSVLADSFEDLVLQTIERAAHSRK